MLDQTAAALTTLFLLSGPAALNDALAATRVDTAQLDDGVPRLKCDSDYLNAAGDRVSLPLTITFNFTEKGAVPSSPEGHVAYHNAIFDFEGHPPVTVSQVRLKPNEAPTDANQPNLFLLDGNFFNAVTTKQDLSATVATVEISFVRKMVKDESYRDWTARCHQVSGWYSKRPS